MKRGKIYWVTSETTLTIKIGYWCGSLVDLHARYVTYYGRELELIVFECKIEDVRMIENDIHSILVDYHHDLELYRKSPELFSKFLEGMSLLTDYDSVIKPLRSPLNFSLRLERKRHAREAEERKMKEEQEHYRSLSYLSRLYKAESLCAEPEPYYHTHMFLEPGAEEYREIKLDFARIIVADILKDLNVDHGLVTHANIQERGADVDFYLSKAFNLAELRDMSYKRKPSTKLQAPEIRFAKKLGRLLYVAFSMNLTSVRRQTRIDKKKIYTFDYQISTEKTIK